MHKLTSLLKIALSFFIFLCLMDMPYGYYEFVRFIAMVGFAFLAFDAVQFERSTETFIFISLAILFQPFLKIALGRELWNIMDVVVGIGLITSIFLNREKIQS